MHASSSSHAVGLVGGLAYVGSFRGAVEDETDTKKETDTRPPSTRHFTLSAWTHKPAAQHPMSSPIDGWMECCDCAHVLTTGDRAETATGSQPLPVAFELIL
jgi:hypothetical protein